MKPRMRLSLLIVFLAALGGGAQGAAPPRAGSGAIRIEEVVSVGLTVTDLDRSIKFFEEALTFERASDVTTAGAELDASTGAATSARVRTVRMKLGGEFLDLVEYSSSSGATLGRPMLQGSRSNDRWFQHIAVVTSDMDKAYARLRQHDVAAASLGGPQRLPDWNKNATGIRAFYFCDPDGHFLEILEFPPGKGDPRWHASSDRLFLGIDHTAIVVADTAASLAYYRDRLGFVVAGESENYGPEQERLNNVRGARLRITTLRPRLGPKIELLEYLNPRDGRPIPDDSRVSDIWHWQIRLRAPMEFVNATAQSKHSLLARDPDGHALLFTDK